jgi:hypothetical protein
MHSVWSLSSPWQQFSSGDSGPVRPRGSGAVARVAELHDAVVAAGGRLAQIWAS